MAIQIKTFPQGLVNANCYVIFDDETKVSAIVDCSWFGLRFKAEIESLGIEKFDYILLTHGHFDHIMGVEKVQKSLGGKIVIHALDESCLSSDVDSRAELFGTSLHFELKADILVKDGDSLPFGNSSIKVIHTPGHTVGGVCYEIENNLFTGDTLFKGTVGRTDFPNGSYAQIIESVKKLAALEGDYNVYPGHEGSSTLDYERKTNPYMK